MVCGDGIHHVVVDIIMLCQGQAAFDDLLGMVALVGGVEMVVTGQDVLLYVINARRAFIKTK